MGTMKGKAWEVVDMMKRRKIGVLCTGDEVERRPGTVDGGGIQHAAHRRRRKE